MLNSLVKIITYTTSVLGYIQTQKAINSFCLILGLKRHDGNFLPLNEKWHSALVYCIVKHAGFDFYRKFQVKITPTYTSVLIDNRIMIG